MTFCVCGMKSSTQALCASSYRGVTTHTHYTPVQQCKLPLTMPPHTERAGRWWETAAGGGGAALRENRKTHYPSSRLCYTEDDPPHPKHPQKRGLTYRTTVTVRSSPQHSQVKTITRWGHVKQAQR